MTWDWLSSRMLGRGEVLDLPSKMFGLWIVAGLQIAFYLGAFFFLSNPHSEPKRVVLKV